MTPIPGDPHKRRDPELTLGDGRKFKVRAPGVEPRPEEHATAERGAAEPPPPKSVSPEADRPRR